MTKSAAVKEREPALDLGMKDITPAKTDTKAKKGGHAKPSTEVATVKPPAVPSNLDTPQDFLALITRALSLKKGDVSNIRELLAMKDEQLEKIRAQEYNTDFHAARGLMPAIVKDKANPSTNSRYPSLENVSQSIDVIARQHHFTHSYATAESNIPGHYRVVCELSHTNGHRRTHFIDYPADDVGPKGNKNKAPVHAISSTMSIARRYLKIMIWDLVIVDQDNDGNGPKRSSGSAKSNEEPIEYQVDESVKKITQKEADNLIDAIEYCGVGRKKFCSHYQINKVDELPADRLIEAMAACKEYASKHGKK